MVTFARSIWQSPFYRHTVQHNADGPDSMPECEIYFARRETFAWSSGSMRRWEGVWLGVGI